MSQPEQRRILATAIPGPKSRKLQEQRNAELAGGLGTTMPVGSSSTLMGTTSSTSPPASR
jgi:hypothetical protein